MNNHKTKKRKSKMNKWINKLKNTSGQSLAEFAVVAAMMGTMATTAAPKFSGVGEGAKGKKTMAEIDKIIQSGSNFYNAKVSSEGRGRFPGQTKYNTAVGGYTVPTSSTSVDAEAVLENALDSWIASDSPAFDDAVGSKWRSVFGISSTVAGLPSGSAVTDNASGVTEWNAEFGSNPIKSAFQDGHYIYVVLPGGGAGTAASSPVLYIADLESPGDYNKKLVP